MKQLGSERLESEQIGPRQLKSCMRGKESAFLVQVQRESETEYRNKQLPLFHRFSDVFVNSLSPTDVCDLPAVKLTFYPSVLPSYQQPYPMSAQQLRLVKSEVEKLLELGIIVPSQSAWGSPVIFVPKKNGQMRMCVDYRVLNSHVVATRFPIPRISQYLENAARSKYFSLIDLKDGYHQLRLAPDSQACTAFSTPDGHFQFTRIPFGLVCAPMEFQRAMSSIFPVWLYPWVQVYLDDILILADTRQQALQRLEEVLVILRHHGIRANARKSELIRTRIHYLGHTIQHGTVGMEKSKVDSIRLAPFPTTVTGLRSFLGMTNYYSRFIPHYASIVAPLTALTGKKVLPPVGPQHFAAFEKVKSSLARMLLLHKYEDSDELEVRLFSDASNAGIGAVIEHPDRRPVAFYSRKLSSAELNYNIYEKELLALVTAAEQWRHILIGNKVKYYVDNRALHWLKSARLTNPRVARWVMRLAVFGLDTQLLRSEENMVADYLSRYSWQIPDSEYKLLGSF